MATDYEISEALQSFVFSHLLPISRSSREMRIKYIEMAMEILGIHDIDLDEDKKIIRSTVCLMCSNAPNPKSLKAVERSHVLSVLNECRGNRAAAALILGINVKTLYNKLMKWELLTPKGQYDCLR